MNPLFLLALPYLFARREANSTAGKSPYNHRRHKWPGRKHPPPARIMPGMPAAPAMKSEEPANQVDEKDHHEEKHEGPGNVRFVHRDDVQPVEDLHTHHEVPTDANAHVEEHHEARKPRHRPRRRVIKMPVQRIVARPQSAPGDANVADLQRILVGLGWRGRLTTKGPVSPDLTDGLYGPVTALDWAQSANKRGLNPAIVRLGPNRAHVDPATMGELQRLASASVVGSIYIP